MNACSLDWMSADAGDLDDNPRLDKNTGTPDMGCFEYVYRGALLLVR